MSRYDHETLYTATVASGDDRDYVTEQSTTGLTLVTADNDAEFARSPMTVEFLGEWLDVGNAVITTARGSYSLTLIKRTDRPAAVGGQSIGDGTPADNIPGGRIVQEYDVVGGDEFGVRVTNMVPPSLGTQLRITYRAYPKGST